MGILTERERERANTIPLSVPGRATDNTETEVVYMKEEVGSRGSTSGAATLWEPTHHMTTATTSWCFPGETFNETLILP